MNDPTEPTTRPPDPTDQPVPAATAAGRLGITSDAVRARIRRGTLQAEKREHAWLVFLPDATEPDKGPDNTTVASVASGTDISPLVALVEDLTAQVRDLSATAAMWQTRSAHLESQLQQLSASVDTPDAPEGETYREHSSAPSTGILTRLKRWFTGDR